MDQVVLGGDRPAEGEQLWLDCAKNGFRMGTLDPVVEELFLGVAHALFVNRLHVLRLTEIVRLGIRPDPRDQAMELPPELDRELIQQAFAYTIHHFPASFGSKIEAVRARWIRLA